MAKKKPNMIYLTDQNKEFLKEQSDKKCESMSAFVNSLIDKDRKRVERGNK